MAWIYRLWEWGFCRRIKKGKYYLFLEFYYPPHYRPGDETAYVNYMEQPLEVRVGGSRATSCLLLLPEIGKKYL